MLPTPSDLLCEASRGPSPGRRVRFSLQPVNDVEEKKQKGLSGGPVVKTLPPNAGGVGSIPGRGAKILTVLEAKTQKRSSIVTNSMETFKMIHPGKRRKKKEKPICTPTSLHTVPRDTTTEGRENRFLGSPIPCSHC